MLHLPPIASAIVTILGVTLAVIRLLTASRPFWTILPNKLQKALPAIFVALGLLPAALASAKSWLDVATAVVLVVGTYFTASRGDQRPPKDSDGGPRLQRSNTDPKVDDTTRIVPEPTRLAPPDRSRLHNDIPDEPAEMRGWHDWRFALVAMMACVGCAAAKPLPCDETKLRAIDIDYVTAVTSACLEYPNKEECPAWPGLRAKHRADLKASCP